MDKRGNARLFFVTFGLLFLFAACGRGKIEPGIPLQELTTEYETEGAIKSVAALEDGTMFAMTESPSGCQIYHFNEQGECIHTYSLEGYHNVDSIAVAEDGETIYFAGQHENIFVYLFAFHVGTGQVDEFCNFFTDLAKTRKLVLLDNKMYVMGQKKIRGSQQASSYDTDYDFSEEDTLLCCSMEDGQYSDLGFEYPINIAPSGKGTLIILAYFPEDGYWLLEYNPKDASVKQKARLDEYKFYDFAVCNNGDSLLYDYLGNSRGLVLADFDSPGLEVEIYDDSIAWVSESRVWYGEGKVYLQDAGSRQLVSFPLDAVEKRNKEVRLVATQELSPIAPYGCGYRLVRLEEEWDRIALRMLAQDRDYDLCLASSAYGGGIVLRDSNVFCPLNDLPGIEEYFNRCFPYVREAATTESGEIWMVPFSASALAMLVQEERAGQKGLALHDNMTLGEFAQVARGLTEEDKGLFFLYPKEVSDEFLNQYFEHNGSALGKDFLGYAESLRVLHQRKDLLFPPENVDGERLLCLIESFGRYPSMEAVREGFSLYSIPKAESTDKNNITLYYFVVNGKSKNRTEALNYLASLIAYLMERDDLWIFQGYEAEEDSGEQQIYHLFENGEVSFAMDEDVYQKNYIEVLEGNQPLEGYVRELERRLRMYLEE